jgi:hypothetical protein
LLYLHDWLESKLFSERRRRVVMGAAGCTALILVVGIPLLVSGPPIERRILLRERYGGEWQYPYGTHVPLNRRTVLTKRFTEGAYYSLTPAVLNDNRTASITATVFLNLPAEIEVQRPRFWRPAEARQGFQPYFAWISEVPPGMENTVDEILRLKFPRPGRYRIPYSISGTADGNGFKPIHGWFTIELTQ